MHVCLRNDGALVGDFQGAHHGFAQIGVGQALSKAIAAYRAATGGAAGFFREGRRSDWHSYKCNGQQHPHQKRQPSNRFGIHENPSSIYNRAQSMVDILFVAAHVVWLCLNKFRKKPF